MKSPFITRVLTTSAFVLGAFALAVAAQSVWTPPTAPPPNGNVPAPINVGITEQIKLGPIRVNTVTPIASPIGLMVGGKIQMVDGVLGAGKVLTDVNGDGIGSWIEPTGGTGGDIYTIAGELTEFNGSNSDDTRGISSQQFKLMGSGHIVGISTYFQVAGSVTPFSTTYKLNSTDIATRAGQGIHYNNTVNFAYSDGDTLHVNTIGRDCCNVTPGFTGLREDPRGATFVVYVRMD